MLRAPSFFSPRLSSPQGFRSADPAELTTRAVDSLSW
jgi:hypothetical protein